MICDARMHFKTCFGRCVLSFFLIVVCVLTSGASQQAEKKLTWKSVEFAILKFDDKPPKSWNIYHDEKRKGLLLVNLWKRYLLVDLRNADVFDLDPQKISVKGSEAEWSEADKPDQPIEIADWSERDVGPVRRYRFRLGKNGHVLEMQLPLKPNGQPMY